MVRGCGARLERALAIALLPLVVACGGDDEPRAHSGVAGSGGSAGCGPGEVAIGEVCQSAGVPAAQCAEGFVPDERDGCSAVLPAEPCRAGLMAVPGETTCREVAPCGDGRWGTIPVDQSTQYVDGSFTGTDSDGTEGKPWSTVQAGVDAAPDGGLVAVAAGIYTEDVLIDGSPVRLWGRCPAMVEIRGSAGGVAAVFVQDDASGSEIRDLGIRGGGLGVAATGSEAIALDRVWIHDTGDRGLVAQDDLGSTEVRVTGSLIEGAGNIGVFVGAATVSLDRSVVRWTRVDPSNETSGRGVDVQDHATARERASVALRSSVVEGNTDIGVFVWGADANVEASVIRGTQPQPDGMRGWAIAIQDHPETGQRSVGTVRASVIEFNYDLAMMVSGSDVTVDATVVRDTLPRAADGAFGRGITIKQDPQTGERAHVTIGSSVFDRNRDSSVFVWGSDATLDSVLVRATEHGDDPASIARAIQVQLDQETGARATASIRSSIVDDNSGLGVVVAESDATLDSTLIRNTRARPSDGNFGDGVSVVFVNGPASAVMTTSRVEGSARAGISTFGAQASVGSTVLECNAIHLAVETFEGTNALLTDLGGNVCGCAGEQVPCAAVSSNLTPPEPLAPTGD